MQVSAVLRDGRARRRHREQATDAEPLKTYILCMIEVGNILNSCAPRCACSRYGSSLGCALGVGEAGPVPGRCRAARAQAAARRVRELNNVEQGELWKKLTLDDIRMLRISRVGETNASPIVPSGWTYHWRL